MGSKKQLSSTLVWRLKMSFILKAPHPGYRTTTVLPSPRWGDSKALASVVTSLKSIDGTTYTYVKSKEGRKVFRWDFEISRNKALELREFIDAYKSSIIQAIDHDGDSWLGYLRNNPFEFSAVGRAKGWPGNETMVITLEFEQK
jgi:hypothetical protein